MRDGVIIDKCLNCGNKSLSDAAPLYGMLIILSFVVFILLLSYSPKTNSKEIVYDNDVSYLTEAIYFESRDQQLIGQVAVGCTVMNRVKSSRWPNTIKGVVHQYKQFSYYYDGKPEIIDDHKAHYVAWLMAERVVNTNICDMFGGIDHYINHDISDEDEWPSKMKFIMKVDDHTFYRSKK